MLRKQSVLPLVFIVTLLVSMLVVPGVSSQALQTPLPGSAIAQFIDPLPNLHTIVENDTQIGLHMMEFQSMVMPAGFVPANGQPYTGTWVWGYLDEATQIDGAGNPIPAQIPSYIGPVIVSERGNATQIKFVNNLGNASTSNVLFYEQATDQSLHWANPLDAPMTVANANPPPDMIGNPDHYSGAIPAVPHLHGGEVPPVLDGGPDAWFTSDGSYQGATYYAGPGGGGNASVYTYPNSQEAASIWFHDHTLGATRLNVYAGLAGAYLITDPNLDLPPALPGPADIVPLVIQDRMFDTNGQLYFPNIGINPEHQYWSPEFLGDTIVVNGKVWPFKNVEQKRYRFLFLNGSNARAYELFLTDPVTKAFGPPMWVIGTDGGYLDTPVKLDPALGQKLLIMPGERYDVIIDFGDTTNNPTPSGSYLLRNTARAPYPKGAPAQGSTTGRVMMFRVGAPPVGGDATYNPMTDGAIRTNVNQQIVRLVNPVAGTLQPGVTVNTTRQLTLNEFMGPGGPLEVLVNNSKWGGEYINPTTGVKEPRPDFTADGFGNYLSELPNEGDTEVWEIVNLTADAHPIHLHLVQFQLINRQNFNVNKYNKAYNALFPASLQIDPMTGMPYPGGVFIGGYGPPKPYDFYATGANIPARGPIYGGNPDITPYLQGKANAPLPSEAGWKDTVIMYPGQVTRIAVRWAPTDKPLNDPDLTFTFDPNANGQGYVWHCHIIDHEDNEMMRPDEVQPDLAAVRTYVMGVDY